MEPEQSGTTGQTPPRGNDWEVVQLTASNYASAPAPAQSEPSDEEPEGQVYGRKGDDSTLLMSGHFSMPRNEAQNLGTGSKERQEAQGSEYAVSDEGNDDRQDKLKDGDDGLDKTSSVDKGKSLSLADTESDDGNMLRGASLASEDQATFSSSGYSARAGAVKELSWLPETQSKTTQEKTEDPTLQNVDRVTGSSEVVASGEESRPEGSSSGVPHDVWLRKQIISLYRSARESNKFWPVIAATAALMGMAYFRRRWLRGKLQLQQVKSQPASSMERINHAVAPLNRIKDILVAGNHPSPAPHGHARPS